MVVTAAVVIDTVRCSDSDVMPDNFHVTDKILTIFLRMGACIASEEVTLLWSIKLKLLNPLTPTVAMWDCGYTAIKHPVPDRVRLYIICNF